MSVKDRPRWPSSWRRTRSPHAAQRALIEDVQGSFAGSDGLRFVFEAAHGCVKGERACESRLGLFRPFLPPLDVAHGETGMDAHRNNLGAR